MGLTLQDIVAEFMRDLRILDGNAGPEVPVNITLEQARAMTQARLQTLRSMGIHCLQTGKEEEAWRVLAHCQKAVAVFNILLDSLESRNQGMAS